MSSRQSKHYRKIANLVTGLAGYYELYGHLPPGALFILDTVGRHPRRYLHFVFLLRERSPVCTAALIQMQHAGDNGPECDGGPVPPGMVRDVRDNVSTVEPEHMRGFQ